VNGAIAIAAGLYHTCALVMPKGDVWCWGANNVGEVGNGTVSDAGVSTAVQVAAITNVKAIAAGYDYTCALLASGGVDCWGYNISGQLGDGTLSPSSTPQVVGTLPSSVTSLVANDDHTCAILSGGTVDCWGANSDGELGNGMVVNALTPTAVETVTQVKSLAAGSLHTCALLPGGAVDCWGENNHGQLGISAMTMSTTIPEPVPDVADASALTAGQYHTCALFSPHTVRCWGSDLFGQLGNGETSDAAISTPVVVAW
jgi:alpha-tubulin suppressor-like RCC1 family protein